MLKHSVQPVANQTLCSIDVDVVDLRAQAYLFIASGNLGMFQQHFVDN